MEKTEMMERYEAETGRKSVRGITDGIHAVWFDIWHYQYLQWLEAKAEAYDRLMSGGKKTPKEWANFTGYVTAVQDNGVGIASRDKPIIVEELGDTGWYPTEADIEAYHYFTIHESLIDYSGDWKDSLTLPDGWEEAK